MGQRGARGLWQSTPTLSGHPGRLLRGENSGGRETLRGKVQRGERTWLLRNFGPSSSKGVSVGDGAGTHLRGGRSHLAPLDLDEV